MTGATPRHGRMKVAAGDAVEQCGGVDGAAATTGRGRSTCGRWLNENETDLPTIDSAVAMDRAIRAQGRTPPIAAAMVRELGGEIVWLPDVDTRGRGDWLAVIGDLTRESSEAVAALCEALTDRVIDRRELAKVAVEFDQAISQLVQARAMVLAGED